MEIVTRICSDGVPEMKTLKGKEGNTKVSKI